MLIKQTRNILVAFLFLSLFFISCAKSSPGANSLQGTSTALPVATTTSLPGTSPTSRPSTVPVATSTNSGTWPGTPPPAQTTPNATPDLTPVHYRTRLLLSGRYRPDDLAFDAAGHLVFSDVYHGTISRLNADGSVTVLVHGLADPEGLVFLPNGTLIIAEQLTNRILAFTPSTSALAVLRVLPGTPSKQACKDGVDGIALDPTTNTLIVPDSPIGVVYRMSLDGAKLTLLAANIPRPVGAAVDPQGNIYVADECGGALWKITPAGQATRMGGFGMLDDVVFDHHGNLLVTDLKPSIHSLIRLRHITGRHEILANRGFIEPQGLAIDGQDDIYLSDDYANKIVEYIPTS